MQFESHSHRGFSPVVSSVTKRGNRFKRFLTTFRKRDTALSGGVNENQSKLRQYK